MRARAEQGAGLNRPTADAGTDGEKKNDAAPWMARQARTDNGLELRAVGTRTCLESRKRQAATAAGAEVKGTEGSGK